MLGEPRRGAGSAVYRFWLLVTDLLSRVLATDEREAVLGDLAESEVGGLGALGSVAGLIIRRQAVLWKCWSPWFGLFGLALPAGSLLSLKGFSLERSADLYLWIFRNRGTIDPNALEAAGLGLRHGMLHWMAGAALLVSVAYVCGFLLGRLSGGVLWVNRTAFCLMAGWAAFAQIAGARPYLYSVRGWVLPVSFYTVVLPLFIVTTLILLPALLGMRRRTYEKGVA